MRSDRVEHGGDSVLAQQQRDLGGHGEGLPGGAGKITDFVPLPFDGRPSHVPATGIGVGYKNIINVK